MNRDRIVALLRLPNVIAVAVSVMALLLFAGEFFADGADPVNSSPRPSSIRPLPTTAPAIPAEALVTATPAVPEATVGLPGWETTTRPGNATHACHPSYTGACVPIASDVDCAVGRGNANGHGGGHGDGPGDGHDSDHDGPEYVEGPVYVVGADVYDLDPDGDRIACDH